MFTEDQKNTINQALSILESHLNTNTFVACSSVVVVDYCKLQLGHLDREVFGVLFLDTQHRLIAFEKIFFGTVNNAVVFPREIAKLALQKNSAAVVLAHNHLSNDCSPSVSDTDITKMLVELMGLIGVKVLDHIIVGQTSYFSFAEEGLL